MPRGWRSPAVALRRRPRHQPDQIVPMIGQHLGKGVRDFLHDPKAVRWPERAVAVSQRQPPPTDVAGHREVLGQILPSGHAVGAGPWTSATVAMLITEHWQAGQRSRLRLLDRN